VPPKTKIKVLDLFAGAGGFTAGFHNASPRFETIRAVEMDLEAAASYEATFGEGIMYNGRIEDWLREEPVPEDVDVVVGGPPCQGFSTLGKQDVEDERNTLWRQYAETIVRAKPKYFVVENVAAFGKSRQYRDFQDAVGPSGFLRDYDFDFQVLNSADFGAPQARKRAVLLGHHRDLPAPVFPRPSHLGRHVTVADALAGVPEHPDSDPTFDKRSTIYAGKRLHGQFSPRDMHWTRSYTAKSLERFAHIPVGGNRFDLPDNLKPACWISHTNGSADVMGRLRWDRPSVTIRTEFFKPEKGRYLHPEAHRAITHYEAALLQGFTDAHRFVGSRTSIARQIGNAVPLALGRAIAAQIEAAL
jgi:DNA (cytosine-5)-methyltransferase 1